MNKSWLAILACGLVGVSGRGGLARSLWTDSSRSLISDRRAAQVGDIVTIVVSERSSASHRADHETEKQVSARGGPGGGWLGLFPDFSAEAERATSGSGAAAQSTSLLDRISAVVIARTPQGHLELQGSRVVRLNQDELVLTVSGTARAEDITAANTVLSTQLANCHIEWRGRGPVAEKQRTGLLWRLLALIF